MALAGKKAASLKNDEKKITAINSDLHLTLTNLQYVNTHENSTVN
jgi:hypothetical protein